MAADFDPKDAWQLWLQRDDRDLVYSLAEINFAPQQCIHHLKPWLDVIVASLDDGRHSAWGQAFDAPDEIYAQQIKFLESMKAHGEWSQIHSDSKKLTPKMFSLPYKLARAWGRHKKIRASGTRKSTRLTNSGLLHLSELPSPTGVARALTPEILGAFHSMTVGLPDTVRLPYQLHLDGLVVPEIAHLLSLTINEVEEAITLAKSLMTADSNMGYGT